MSFKCSAFSCKSKSDNTAKNAVSFFEFPSTPRRKQNWLESIGRPLFKPLRSSRVCSNHFDEKYFNRNDSQVILKSDAVPISLNSAEATPRLMLNSSRSSEENILSNNNKRVQVTSEVEQIGIKRPRRNTVYVGSYKVSRTNRVATPPSQITTKDLCINTRVNSQRTNHSFKEPKNAALTLVRNQSTIEKQFSKEFEDVIQRQRNQADVGPNNVGIRAVVASATQRTNNVSIEPKKTPPHSQGTDKYSGPMIERPMLISSRSSGENILSNENKRVQITSMSEVQQIGIMRPRRNTVYMGSYKLNRTNNVQKPPSQITQADLRISTPVTTGNRRTNRTLEEPKKMTPTLAKNLSSIEKQVSKELAVVIQRQRNPADVHPNNVGVRSVAASATQRPNLVSMDPKKTLPLSQCNEKYSGPTIQRQPDAAKDISDLSILKLLIAKNFQATNRVSKVTKKRASMPSRNQSSIEKYFPKKMTATSEVVTVKPEETKIEDCIFGWSVMGHNAVPFIVRNSEKFCALRMFVKIALGAYKKPIIGPCSSSLECFSPSRTQCELLNEINFQHCNSAFGKEKFSIKDKLVRLKDAHKYFTFVDLCHEPLMKGIRVQSEGLEFGFTVVNKTSYIPHIIRNERKFIPLSYLLCDNDISDILEQKALTLSGSDALFLKFCCKFDGFSGIKECTEVIELLELRRLVPPSTKFQDCWPSTGENDRLRLVVTKKGLSFEFVKRNYQHN